MATKRRRRIPVYHVETGDPGQFKEDKKLPGERFTYSSNGNRREPTKVSEVFEKFFVNYVNKTPFEPDEVTIYRYGIHIRPRIGVWNEHVEDDLKRVLQDYPGSSMHVVDEGSTFSVRINLGSKTRDVLAGDASDDLEKQQRMIEELYATVANEYKDTKVEWWTFFETDQELPYE